MLRAIDRSVPLADSACAILTDQSVRLGLALALGLTASVYVRGTHVIIGLGFRLVFNQSINQSIIVLFQTQRSIEVIKK